MKEAMLFSNGMEYTVDEIIAASSKIAASFKKNHISGKDVMIDSEVVFRQIAAEHAAWSLGCRVFEAEPGTSATEAFSLVIDDAFIAQALAGDETEPVTPRFYGTILFYSLNGTLCALSGDEMKQRFDFLRDVLHADREETFFYGEDMSYLKFFPLYCGGSAYFGYESADEGGLVMMPSAELESSLETAIVPGADVIITFGSETYGESVRENLKKSGKRIFHIFDLPQFTFMTSGTNFVGVPVRGVSISVVNSSGIAQPHGMKGYIRNQDSGEMTGYEGIYLGKGKYALSYPADLAVARGRKLDSVKVKDVLRSCGDTEITDVQVCDNRLHMSLRSDMPLSSLIEAMDTALPRAYRSVKLTKASSVSKGEYTYSSDQIRELMERVIGSRISIDSVYDRKFTLEISGTETQLAEAENRISACRNINKVIFRNSETGACEEKNYQSLNDQEKNVMSVFCHILGVEEIGLDDNFFELGGNSLMFVKLCYELELATHRKIDTNLFFKQATAGNYCRLAYENATAAKEQDIMMLSGEVTPELLIHDSMLESFVPENEKPQGDHIFLTGGTGFLGTFLLSELLKKTNRDIYCLVRAENPEKGLRRLWESAEKYGLSENFDSQRVKVVLGDLSEPHLGISDADYSYLLHHIEKIVHAGAKVDFMYTYPMLKKTNVDAVREVIELAAHGAEKELHYVSTLAVLEDNMYQGEAAEDFDNWNYPAVIFGYNQSKWVGDVLVQRAMRNGLRANIYRIGTACGDSVHGRWQDNDLIRSVSVLCLKVGSTPLFDHILHLVPVDRLASSIASCVCMGIHENGRILHLGGGKEITVVQMAEWLNNYDLNIEIVSADTWIERATKYVEANREALKDQAIFGIVHKGVGFDFDFGCTIMTEQTDRYFESLGIAYQSVTEDEFDKCLDSIKMETGLRMES